MLPCDWFRPDDDNDDDDDADDDDGKRGDEDEDGYLYATFLYHSEPSPLPPLWPLGHGGD